MLTSRTAFLVFTTIVTVVPSVFGDYCELFQLPGFRGESLRVPSLHEITNLSRLTRAWERVAPARPPPLYSVQVQEGLCTANVCSLENFEGNCTRLTLSRKRIRASRLRSLSCQCNGTLTKSEVEPNSDASSENSHTVLPTNQTCQNSGDAQFRDFVTNGRKIIGVGRNYIWNQKQTAVSKLPEVPDKPIIFLKPTSSYLEEGNLIKLPDDLGTIWYEIELGVVIGKSGRDIREENALDHVAGYTLALDLTAKEFMQHSIGKGLPWVIGKGFDTACPVGPFIPKACIPDPQDVQLSCRVNGELKQDANTSGMIFKIPQLISYISQYMTLEPNDIILTGTPDGLGPIKSGDVIQGSLSDISRIQFTVQ